MTAALVAAPNPVSPSATLIATGSGFTDNVATRLLLGSSKVTGQFRPSSGAFSVPVVVGSTSRTQSLIAQQKVGRTWTVVTSTPVVIESTAAAPKILTQTVDVTTTTAVFTWTLDVAGTGQVEYGPITSPQTYPSLTTLEPNLYPTHSQTATGLSAGTPYAYRLLSGNSGGSAALVARTFGTLSAAPSVPGAPTGLTAVAGDTTVDLAWVAPSTGGAPTGYKVYRGVTLVATIGNVLVFHDVGRTNGVLVSYTVKATNAAGDGTASGAATATPAASGVTFPPDRNPVVYVATPTVSDPGYLSAIVDSTWLTHVKRISSTRGVRHAYSRMQPWSKDGDFIMLPFTGAGQTARLINGTTYADIGTFSPPAMAVWSNTVNDRIFGVTGNQLIRRTMAGTTTVVHTFSGYSTISLGEYEGGISDDDKYVALIGNPGGSAHLLVYRIDTDAIIADIAVGTSIGDCQISRLGNYVTAATGTGLRVYPQNLASYVTLYSHYSHGDNTLDAAGNEIYVANNDGGSPIGVSAWRLSTGARTTLVTGPQAFGYGHVSGHHNRNGWVYLSNYDEVATAGMKGNNQVVAVKTDGSGTVEVFANAHHAWAAPDPPRYDNEPHAAASRDGSRVIFASNWGNTAVEPYAYVAYP